MKSVNYERYVKQNTHGLINNIEINQSDTNT